MAGPLKTTATVIPALRHRDAPAAIEWLCRAFGFERHRAVPGENGSIARAQLRIGNGMMMPGSAGDGHFDAFVKPAGRGAPGTWSGDVLVDDPDAHRARAVAAGAEIVREIESPEHGGRVDSGRDPEGHVGSFGSYDPWA